VLADILKSCQSSSESIQFIPSSGAHPGENLFMRRLPCCFTIISSVISVFKPGQIVVAQIQQEKDFQFMCASALSYCG
jgi:hypothetical protein